MNLYPNFLTIFFVLAVNTFSQESKLDYNFNVKDSMLLAFPEAEGWGKYTAGGRAGKIIEVTNLNDNGSGSLRDAVEREGARIVVFRISGTIKLISNITLKNDSITIAGQTAPGDGICISNYPFEISASEVIIRYIRFRHGDESGNVGDALNILGSKNVIIDHCSMSWGIDEAFTCYSSENVTVQWCIISESLNNSYHPKGPHGYGGIWGGTNISYHHNLLAHHSSRNPRFSGSNTTPAGKNVDFRNNVIYNWGFNSSYGGESGTINIVGNYYKPGPGTLKKVKCRIVEPWDSSGRWFIENNFVEGFPEISLNNWNGGVQGKYSDIKKIKSFRPFNFVPIQMDTPEEAFNKVLEYAGVILPSKDTVDKRIVYEVKNGTATYGSNWYAEEHNINSKVLNGIIDSQIEVGGFPVLNSAEPLLDSDHDGIPDTVELKYGLNPNDYSDRNKISAGGYSYVEKYINSLGSIDSKNIKCTND